MRDYPMGPRSRRTVYAGDDPALVDTSFGARVDFDIPGMAERAMYFGSAPLFNGGHRSAGVTTPATDWFLAEGATGSFFSTFVLLANPDTQPADVTLTYLPASGAPIVKHDTIAPGARMTRNIAGEDPTLADAAVGDGHGRECVGGGTGHGNADVHTDGRRFLQAADDRLSALGSARGHRPEPGGRLRRPW